MPTILHKLSVYPTLYFGCFLEYIGIRKWYTRIDDFTVLGALPMKRNYKEIIAAENIKGVISMNEDHELAYSITKEKWTEQGVDFKQVPVLDYIGTADLEQIKTSVEFINSYREKNQSVYIHCKAGRYRSALIAACYLINNEKFTPEQARDHLKTLRPIVILDKKRQMLAMQGYFNYLYKK